jgi:TRAP-type C4-dicarboxylate transport system substrate-binding protein
MAGWLPAGKPDDQIQWDRTSYCPSRKSYALKKHAGEQLAEIWGRAYDDVNRNYRQRLEAQGHTIVTPSSNDNRHMTRITNQMISEWIAVGSHRSEIISAFRAELQRIQ